MTRSLRLVREPITLRAYVFVGTELLPGSPFIATGETWGDASTIATSAIASAVTATHAAAIAEPRPEGAVLAVVTLLGTMPNDRLGTPRNDLLAVAAALKACRESTREDLE
jgi:hypothetical protein